MPVFFTRHPKVSDLLCVALIVAVTGIMFYALFVGEPPLSGDHSAHYMRAWILENQLLQSGHLFAWSNRWFAGYPVNYTYPFGADMLVVLMHQLTLGALSLAKAYALMVVAAYAASGIALFVFARSTLGRIGALIAALLMIVDPGMYPAGGWHATVQQGVWPAALSIGAALMALHALRQLLLTPTARTAAILALWTAASLILHPAAILNDALLFGAMIIVYWWTEPTVLSLKTKGLLIIAMGLGGGIASLGLIPLMSTVAYRYAIPDSWKTFEETLTSVLSGELLPNLSIVLFCLGLVGIVWMGRQRKPDLLFCALIVPMIIVFSLQDGGEALFRYIFPSAAEQIVFPRFMMLMKPFWFIADAYVIVRLVQWSWCKRRCCVSTGNKYQRIVPTVGVMCVMGFLGAVAYQQIGYMEAARRYVHESFLATEHETKIRNAFVAWVNQQPKTKEFYRIAIDMDKDSDFRSVDLASQTAVPLLAVGWTPALLFASMPRGWDARMFASTNVKYVLTQMQLAPKNFTPVTYFGDYTLYAFRQWDSSLFTVEPAQPRKVRVLQWSDERIVIEANAPVQGTLILHQAFFPRWQVTRDGHTIAVKPYAMTGYDALSVGLQPGTYIFTFVPSLWERIAPLFFLSGVIVCLLMIGTPKVLCSRRFR